MRRRDRHHGYRPEYFRLDPDSPLAEGLVFAGLGRFPGSNIFDDATESIWGGGNHGVLTSMDPAADWLWEPELGRWCLDFDGINDYVQTGAVDLSNGGVDIPCSWGCWVRPAVTTGMNFIGGIVASKSLTPYGVAQYTTGRIYAWVSNDATASVGRYVEAGTVTAGNWYHIWVNYTGSEAASGISIFVNGKQSDSGNWTNGTYTGMVDNGNPLIIGGRSISYLGEKYGAERIASAMIYRGRTLTSSEISELADPSNVMLSGLIVPQPSRRLWAGYVAAGGFQPAWAAGINSFIGIGA